MKDDGYYVATLGPENSCSQIILARNLHRFPPGAHVMLCSTYEEAKQSVIEKKAEYALVAAAYARLNELTFGDPRKIEMSNCWLEDTPELVMAARPGDPGETPSPVRLVGCMIATVPLARNLYPDTPQHLGNSNSDVARLIAEGVVDVGVTTGPAAESRGLQILHGYGAVPMTWVVFRPRADQQAV
jgi:hypothetical protein